MTTKSTTSSQQFLLMATAPGADDDIVIKRRHKPHVLIRIAPLNITSMMDLTFNLLLFFVLTASFSIGEGSLPADLPAGTGSSLPDHTTPAAPPENPLILSLHFNAANQIIIQFEGTNLATGDYQDLFQKLQGWQHNAQNPAGIYQPTNPIMIKPDPNVPWSHVVNCFNAVMRARYTNVGFAPATNAQARP